jgi:hypothetical protein
MMDSKEKKLFYKSGVIDLDVHISFAEEPKDDGSKIKNLRA